MDNLPQQEPLHKIGILSDTHVPDRFPSIAVSILKTFQTEGVDHIFHAGDISHPSVLKELGRTASVTAVRGNRDIYLLRSLPSSQVMNFGGIEIALTHGHGGLSHYLRDKVLYFRDGYDFERYQQPMSKMFPTAQIVVFGHTHHQIEQRIGNQVYINPGAAFPNPINGFTAQCALLYIYPSAQYKVKLLRHAA